MILKKGFIISLHALLGTRDSQTIRLWDKIKNLVVIILVDTDSTHNFLDQRVVKRFGIHTKSVNALSVSVANGDKIWVTKLYSKVQWESGGVHQQTDCLVLPLKGCDMVLGIQRMKDLVIWDFMALTMRFTIDNQWVTLYGIATGRV